MTTYSLHVYRGEALVGECLARGEAADPGAFWNAHAMRAASLPDRFDHPYLRIEVRERGRAVALQTLFPEECVSAMRDGFDLSALAAAGWRRPARPAFEDLGLRGADLRRRVREWREEQAEGAAPELQSGGAGARPILTVEEARDTAERSLLDAARYYDERTRAIRPSGRRGG